MRNSNLPSLLLLTLCVGLYGCSGDNSATDELPPDATAETSFDQSTTDGGPDADASADGDVNACSPPNLLCQDHCIDPKTDYTNCGTCGHACTTGEVCSAGKCDFVCSGGTEKCGNSCVDTKLDINNCGTCGAACPWGESCVASKCELVCSVGPEGSAGGYGRVHLVDMDGDGKLDIFGGVGPETTAFQPAVLLGRSDGTFFPPKYLSTQVVWDLDAADLNNDGRADLVACTHDLKMKVWLSNLDATLTFVSEYPGCVSPTIADLDGDSLPDIVNKNGVGSVALLFNKGDGTFEKTSLVYGKHQQGEVSLVDLNNDSLPDIVVPDDQETNSVSILLNQGGRKFSQEYRYRTNQKPDIDAMGNNRAGNVFFLDLNSDGSPDLITDGGKAFKGMRVLLNGCGL